jgi:hypothetical protein
VLQRARVGVSDRQASDGDRRRPLHGSARGRLQRELQAQVQERADNARRDELALQV